MASVSALQSTLFDWEVQARGGSKASNFRGSCSLLGKPSCRKAGNQTNDLDDTRYSGNFPSFLPPRLKSQA